MRTLVATILLAAALAGAAQAASPLDAFAPFGGKTFRGTFTDPGGKVMTDVSHWEMILGGKAVRSVHSLNDGEYGGETLIFMDGERQGLAFVYVTTAGFRTEGTIEVVDDGFTSHEVVKGDAGGITEVRATAKLLPDGTMTMVSEFLQGGQWKPGHTITYVEDPLAEVLFR
ncbi:MAG TPA: hypothetical protein PLQ13_04025 [Candidatus Krumholzibacteria bacterium]|nr:hypothetical protein [Candidatus Krumholzibacteria bacterium]